MISIIFLRINMSSLAASVITWLHTQKDWLQEMADRLLENEELSGQDINEIVQLIKTTQGQRVTDHRKFEKLITLTVTHNELRLNSIGNIQGIANLAPKTPLNFGEDNLVVIYGHNGSGKSSYSKILKSISGNSRAAELKFNVFLNTPQSQSCDISYSTSSKFSITWNTQDGAIDALRAIDIFDSDESNYYLSKEKSVTYTPKLIRMFEELAKACDLVKGKLQQEEQNLISSLPDIPTDYLNTEIAGSYNKLKANMPEDEILALITWTVEDQTELSLLNERLKELDPIARGQELKATKVQIDSFIKIIENVSKSYCDINIGILREIKLTIDKNKKIAEESAELNSNGLVKGVGSETWKAMWEAARVYSETKAYPTLNYPVTQNARCILCQQELLGDTQQRLIDFEKFVQGEVVQEI